MPRIYDRLIHIGFGVMVGVLTELTAAPLGSNLSSPIPADHPVSQPPGSAKPSTPAAKADPPAPVPTIAPVPVSGGPDKPPDLSPLKPLKPAVLPQVPSAEPAAQPISDHERLGKQLGFRLLEARAISWDLVGILVAKGVPLQAALDNSAIDYHNRQVTAFTPLIDVVNKVSSDPVLSAKAFHDLATGMRSAKMSVLTE